MVAQVHDQARRMGALRAVALCRCFSGALHFQNGNWSEAASALSEAVELYRKIGGASGESLSLQRQGVLLTAQGDLDHAMAAFHAGVFAAERATMRSHCLTRLYSSMARNRIAAGDAEAAAEYLRHGEMAARRHGHCVTCNALILPEGVRVRIALGEISEADANAAELERIGREFGSAAWMGMARQARGRVASAQKAWNEAATAFADAAVAYRAISAPYDVARCLAAGASIAVKMGDSPRGAALAAEAAGMFRDLGAPGIES
ncbi:MAG TPA: hypothetical protein VHL58_05120 [Thermoanaerobaculia bacterium]|nr:hypothetical protein [Thermoanaerobaculia bacterium]